MAIPGPRTAAFLLSSLSCLALLVAPSTARAQAPLPPVEESVVVTATLSPEERERLGTSVTVITREEIERTGAVSLADALRQVPGLDVVRSGGGGAVSFAFLRGANSTQALVLVDGVRVNSPYFSGYDLSGLTVESIERIEVVRGPFSALYGADAVGGVVQVFTRAAAGGAAPPAQVRAEAGTDGFGQLAFSGRSGLGPLAVGVSVRAVRDDGPRDNDAWDQDNAQVRLDYRAGPALRLGLEASRLDGTVEVPGPVGGETPDAVNRFLESRIAAPATIRWSDRHDTDLVVARTESSPVYENPSDPYGFTFSETSARTVQVRAADRRRLGSHLLAVVGSWERWAVSEVNAYGTALGDDARTSLWGIGVQDTVTLPGGWSGTAGLRYDRHSLFGDAVSPRLTAARVSPEGAWTARASVGRAFRSPSVGELYYPFSGNAALQPERGTSFEVGLERRFPQGRVEGSLFRNDWRDLIVYDFATGLNENVGRARARGVELSGSWSPSRAWAVDASYTRLHSENLATGDPLLRRPRDRASASLVVRPGRASITARLRYVGERLDADPLAFGSTVLVGGYLHADLLARWERPGRTSPFLRVENVFDRAYEEARGYPAPGRRIAAGLDWRLPARES